MAKYPNVLAGTRIDAALIASMLPDYVYKPAATDRTSTTTFANDPDLVFTLAANAVYVLEFHLLVGGIDLATDSLMKTEWTVPAGATGLKGIHGPGSLAVEADANNISGRFGSHGFGTDIIYGRRDASTNLLYAIETGTLITTSAGTCALAWAQTVSSATALRMGLGSWARATRLV